MSALYERGSLVDELVSLATRCSDGGPRVVFVSGDAGLGKTAVLTAAVDAIRREARGTVVDVQAPLTEAGIPFGLAVQIAEALGSTFTRAMSRPAVMGPSDARVSRFTGILELLRAAAAARPLTLAIDDLQWADSDSLALVAFIIRRVRTAEITMLVTLRPFPTAASEMASEQVHDGYAFVRSLAPLSPDSVRLLLEDRSAKPVSLENVQRACALSAGNPLLLVQLGKALATGQGLPDRLPGTLSLGAFVARFSGAHGLSLQYASAVSVLGQCFRPSLADEVAQLGEREASDALAELCANGLLRQERPGYVSFTHELVRQAFYDQLPAPVRARLHARAFELLRAAGAPLGECAEQAMQADLAGNRAAVETLTSAGIEAIETGAAATGRRYLTAAVGLARGHTDRRVRLAIGWASVALGDTRAALDAAPPLRRPADDPDGLRVEAARLRLHALVASGRYREVTAELTTSVRHLEKTDPAAAAALLVEGSVLLMPAAGPVPVRELVTTARGLGWADPEVAQQVESLDGLLDTVENVSATAPVPVSPTWHPGHPPAPAAVGSATPDSGPLVSEPLDPVVAYARLEGELVTEQFSATDDVYEGTVLRFGEECVPRLRAMCDIAYACGLVRRGRLMDASALLNQASERDLSALAAVRTTVGQALVQTELGDVERAVEHCREAEQRAGPGLAELPFVQLWLGRTRAVLALEKGDVDSAVAHVQRLQNTAVAARILEPCVVPWMDVAVQVLLVADDLTGADDILNWSATVTAPTSCAWPRAALLSGQAQLRAHLGDLEGAGELFDAALAWHQVSLLPLAKIETLLAYGSTLRRGGHPSAARPLLLRGLQLAEALEAGRLAKHCRHELQVAGGRRRRRGRAPDSLTAAETRVIDLARTGLSNAEIARSLCVSVRTVESHLGHAYPKLGVGSRRQLLASAAMQSS